jgi:hypothetical protein
LQTAATAGAGVATLVADLMYNVKIGIWLSVALGGGVVVSMTLVVVIIGRHLASAGLLGKCCS